MVLWCCGYRCGCSFVISEFNCKSCCYFPLSAPDLVIVQSSSSTSLVVKWSHVPEKQFKGRRIGYNISYYPPNLRSNFKYVNVNYTTNTTTLTNLTVYTKYVVSVSAMSSGGMGPANTVKARTDAEGTVVLIWYDIVPFWLKKTVFL